MLCATKNEEIFSCQMPFKKDGKAVELCGVKHLEKSIQDNVTTETSVKEVAKEQLRKIVEIFMYGHFYPLPLFGKLSPQLAGGVSDSNLDTAELKKDYGQMLFVDLQDAYDSKEKEEEKELLRSLAEVCYGSLEGSKRSDNSSTKDKGTKRGKKDAAGEEQK